MPDLGTIGVNSIYLLDKNYQPKTIATLNSPIRLIIDEVKIEEREFFKKKDSLNLRQLDSTLVTIQIVDKVLLAQELSANKDLLKHLKKADNYSIVSEVTIHFPKTVLSKIRTSDELYLVQNKEKTLSLELRKDNKSIGNVEFEQGRIVDFKTSNFCWGLNRRREAEVFDIIPAGSSCSKETYKSAKMAEKKNEFKF